MSITDDVDNEIELAFDKGVAHENGRITRALNRVTPELERLLGSYWTQAKRTIAAALRAPGKQPAPKKRRKQ